MINDDAPSAIRALLVEHGLTLKKRWGQNFMISRGARESIIEALAIEPTDTVWEIGPGLGALSAMLAQRIARLGLFEIDWGLIGLLRERFGSMPNVSITPGDAVKTIGEQPDEFLPDLVCGNLPYASGAAIITSLLDHDALLARARCMVFTLQLEGAQRLAAAPGNKAYGSLSVFVQLSAKVELLRKLSAGSFYPSPQVTSAVIRLTPEPVLLRRRAAALAQALFSSRRKTIRNTLPAAAEALGCDHAALCSAVRAARLELTLRPEAIAPESYVRVVSLLDAART